MAFSRAAFAVQPVAMGMLLGQGWQCCVVFAKSSNYGLGLCCGAVFLGFLTCMVLSSRSSNQPYVKLSLFWLSCTLNGGLSAIAQLRLHVGSFRANDDALVMNSFLSSVLLGISLPHVILKISSQPEAEVIMPCVLALLVTEAVCTNEMFPLLQVIVSIFLCVVGLQGVSAGAGKFFGAASGPVKERHKSSGENASGGPDAFFPATVMETRCYSPHFLVSRHSRSVPRDAPIVPLISLVARHESGGAPRGKGKERGNERRRRVDDGNERTLPQFPGPDELKQRHKSTLEAAEVGSEIRWDVIFEEMRRVDGTKLDRPGGAEGETSAALEVTDVTAPLEDPVEIYAELTGDAEREEPVVRPGREDAGRAECEEASLGTASSVNSGHDTLRSVAVRVPEDEPWADESLEENRWKPRRPAAFAPDAVPEFNVNQRQRNQERQDEPDLDCEMPRRQPAGLRLIELPARSVAVHRGLTLDPDEDMPGECRTEHDPRQSVNAAPVVQRAALKASAREYVPVDSAGVRKAAAFGSEYGDVWTNGDWGAPDHSWSGTGDEPHMYSYGYGDDVWHSDYGYDVAETPWVPAVLSGAAPVGASLSADAAEFVPSGDSPRKPVASLMDDDDDLEPSPGVMSLMEPEAPEPGTGRASSVRKTENDGPSKARVWKTSDDTSWQERGELRGKHEARNDWKSWREGTRGDARAEGKGRRAGRNAGEADGFTARDDVQDRWAYVDPKNEVQAGFSTEEMRQWFDLGYFDRDLFLGRMNGNRAPPWREFYPLKQWFPDVSKAFTYSPTF